MGSSNTDGSPKWFCFPVRSVMLAPWGASTSVDVSLPTLRPVYITSGKKSTGFLDGFGNAFLIPLALCLFATTKWTLETAENRSAWLYLYSLALSNKDHTTIEVGSGNECKLVR